LYIKHIRAGKTYTLRGKTDKEDGWIIKAVQDLLPFIKTNRLVLSIYYIENNGIIDLLGVTRDYVKVCDISEHVIRTPKDVFEYIKQSDFSKKTHLLKAGHIITSIRLFDGVRLISQIQFAELAGNDTSLDSYHTFSHLSSFLIEHALGKPTRSADTLQSSLLISMNPRSQVLFICCVSPGKDGLEQSIRALKYATEMRISILSENKEEYKRDIRKDIEHEVVQTKFLNNQYPSSALPKSKTQRYQKCIDFNERQRLIGENTSRLQIENYLDNLQGDTFHVLNWNRGTKELMEGKSCNYSELHVIDSDYIEHDLLHSSKAYSTLEKLDSEDGYKQEEVKLKEKLKRMEGKTKELAKSLKSLLKGSGQTKIMQQFDSIYEETKGIYEGHIMQLEKKMKESLRIHRNEFEEKELEFTHLISDLKKQIKHKDQDVMILKEKVDMLQNDILKKDNEKLLGADNTREVERLNEEIRQLMQELQEKKKENLKNDSLIKDMNKEIIELKKRLELASVQNITLDQVRAQNVFASL